MVLEWREREHEDMDKESLQDAPTVNVLRQSGLLKFFCASHMRSNVGRILGANFSPVGYFSMFFSQKRFTILHFLKPCFAQF